MTARTATRGRAPDGTVTRCRGCRGKIWWFSTNYGDNRRVSLDFEPVEPKPPLARYFIDWDATPPIAVSIRWLSHIQPDPTRPMYSAHLDTCPAQKPGARR